MYRSAIGFLFVACVFSGAVSLSFIGAEHFDGLIRLPLTQRIRRAADENGLPKIAVKNPSNRQYGVQVEIGTPPQQFWVFLDSGSTDLWVSSGKNEGERNALKKFGVNNSFDETASSTFQKGNGDFFLGYQGNSVNGTIAIDTVSLGGLTAKNQPFGLALSGGETGKPFDGILGISYEFAAQTDNSTFIDRLYEQGQIKQRISCVKLRLNTESESQYIVGGCDVEADSWIPVLQVNNQYTGWRANLTKIVLRSTTDNSELLTLETNVASVFDTGADSYIGIPQKFLDSILKSLVASDNGEHYLVDCSNRTSLPNIEFYFGETKITMTLDTYSWVYYDECQLGFTKGGDDFLFGDLLFNVATVIFDKGNNRIGIGPK